MLLYPATCVNYTETVLLVEEIIYQNYPVKSLFYGTYKINAKKCMVKLDFLTLMASYLTCYALVAPGKQHLHVQV